MDNRSHNRHDTRNDSCPVRVIKWGKGQLVTVKLQPGLTIAGTVRQSEDRVGATMLQFELPAPVAAEQAPDSLESLLGELVDVGKRIFALAKSQAEQYVGV